MPLVTGNTVEVGLPPKAKRQRQAWPKKKPVKR